MACGFTGVARKLTSSKPVYKRSFWKVVGNPERQVRGVGMDQAFGPQAGER
jgi:hypothetical protein